MHRPKRIARRAWADWAYFYGQTRAVDVHTAYMRKLLAGGQASSETVAGVGDKLAA